MSRTHVGVQYGDGLVGRFGDAVVVLGTSSEDGFTDALLAALEAAEETKTPAEELAWQIADLLGRHRDNAPAFALAAPVAEGHLLLLHGPAHARSGPLTVTGRDALTWVDHVLPAPVESIALTLTEDATVRPDPRSDLRGGLVPGIGLVITLGSAGAAAPDAAAPNAAVDADDQPATELMQLPVGAEPISEPLAVPAAAPEPDVTTAMAPIVDEPDEHEQAGFQPAQPDRAGQNPSSGPVPIASLIADDGSRTPLDRAYVFGREPQLDDAVMRGAATPVPVYDPDNSISRVQTYLWVNQNGVFLRDANSANGTFVAAPGAADWVRLGDEPAGLPAGWSIRMGRRVFTHVTGR